MTAWPGGCAWQGCRQDVKGIRLQAVMRQAVEWEISSCRGLVVDLVGWPDWNACPLWNGARPPVVDLQRNDCPRHGGDDMCRMGGYLNLSGL